MSVTIRKFGSNLLWSFSWKIIKYLLKVERIKFFFHNWKKSNASIKKKKKIEGIKEIKAFKEIFVY